MTPDEITCRELVALVTDYFEGVLDEQTVDVVEEHLIMCYGCETYVKQMRIAISLTAEAMLDEPEPRPSAAVLAALQARRKDGGDDRI